MNIRFSIWVGIITFITIAWANEPLWLRYPAISPDGQTIVFSYHGDLFQVQSSGGKATPLTGHIGHEKMPVWSPDGQNIAFASDRHGNYDVFLMSSSGGSPKRLTYHSANDNPSGWHPDGKTILFESSRLDHRKSTLFPRSTMSELYSVSVKGDLPKQLLTTPAQNAIYSPNGKSIYYQDRKGVESHWRKHHTSSEARDIWKYNIEQGSHVQLTDFEGEDRNPLTIDSKIIYFLSEKSGSFNIWKMDEEGKNREQITDHEQHPVRFLTISNNGILCYSFDGSIYIFDTGKNTKQKIYIEINTDLKSNLIEYKNYTDNATEMAVSPDGKEIAFIVRGEIFVTSANYETTKRITNTPEQERNVSFAHDGRTLIYSGERSGSWNIYKSYLKNDGDRHFYNAVEIVEEPVIETDKETFQPKFSPNDSLLLYLEERTELKILELFSGKSWTVLPGDKNYSYSDGDQQFEWSPDGNWITSIFLPSPNRWMEDVCIISKTGDQIINITESGYYFSRPRWSENGDVIYCFSQELGMRSHGSWGSQSDIFGFFISDSTYEHAKLSQEEYEEFKEIQDINKDNDDERDDENDQKKLNQIIEPLEIDLEDFKYRKMRFTPHSSSLSDAVLMPDGEVLVYLAKFEKGYDLWKIDLRERTPELIAKLNAKWANSIQFDTTGSNLFVLTSGGIMQKINIDDGEQKTIEFNAEMELNTFAEREYLFEHIWRQIKKKFYVEDMHNVNWERLKKQYSRFLPYINNNRDFAEMVSELLGELNASHTGCYFRLSGDSYDHTAGLGLFFDHDWNGTGLKIAEILKNGPVDKFSSKVTSGMILKKINGQLIKSDENYFPYLNRKSDEKITVTIFDPQNIELWDEVWQPISLGTENNLLYHRWIENQYNLVDSLSNGKVGYVHVRGMNDSSFRKTYSEIFGRNLDKKALIVDTRFNGGGWLHDDLAKLLSGTDYVTFEPRGQMIGKEPQNSWTKPVVVVFGEGNYSDAHFFPYTFDILEIGTTVGMPIPGTTTAVWWERLQDKSLVFGIPQVGVKDIEGEFLENNQLDPDFKVKNDPESIAQGRDKQIEKSVQLLLEMIEDR